MDGGVGARLREARLQRGIDLTEVETATKIQIRFLRAIENEEWDTLPGEFYARSFVRSYASYLGLAETGMAERIHRGGDGGTAERTPRIDPAPQPGRSGRRRPSPRTLAALATAGLVATLVAVELSGPGDDSAGPAPARPSAGAGAGEVRPDPSGQARRRLRSSLTLTATAEVWVCLIDAGGRALIDGQILEPGSQQGPYRSGSFTFSLGNGAVAKIGRAHV